MKRKHWRYLLIDLHAEIAPALTDITSAIIQTIKNLFGELGFSQIEARVLRYNSERKSLLIRCRREHVPKLQFGLLFIKEINKSEVNLSIVRISGTIKSLNFEKSNLIS
ncbi:Rpp14/Pop5 family protein [[Eubacterium] cellulosolvens]